MSLANSEACLTDQLNEDDVETGTLKPRQITNAHVLVVEDDPELREALVDTLELAGLTVSDVESAERALQVLAANSFDMVVSDVNMPGMDGHELLAAIQREWPHIPVLLITAYGSIQRSVDAIRGGAVDYLVKPFKPPVLVDLVLKHVGSAGLNKDSDLPVAEEPSSKDLLSLARRVAQADCTVLLCGESGTGKEVLARFIHHHSARAKQVFVAVNCAAIPENMLEAMLFGHEKGAYTGAYQSAPGKFEQANGGTLLLDEISEMDIGLQAKLLRVLQEREVERLGGRQVIPLDVRVIATTNQDLQEAVKAGRFREDLYYRLSVFPLTWLPLRDRPADIVPIAKRLLEQHAVKMNHIKAYLNSAAKQKLNSYSWPGNVRELDNVLQRALILQGGAEIGPEHLLVETANTTLLSNVSALESEATTGNAQGGLGHDLRQREYQLIIDTLKAVRGSRKLTAERLGISPRTLRYKIAKMREYGLDPDNLLFQ